MRSFSPSSRGDILANRGSYSSPMVPIWSNLDLRAVTRAPKVVEHSGNFDPPDFLGPFPCSEPDELWAGGKKRLGTLYNRHVPSWVGSNCVAMFYWTGNVANKRYFWKLIWSGYGQFHDRPSTNVNVMFLFVVGRDSSNWQKNQQSIARFVFFYPHAFQSVVYTRTTCENAASF